MDYITRKGYKCVLATVLALTMASCCKTTETAVNLSNNAYIFYDEKAIIITQDRIQDSIESIPPGSEIAQDTRRGEDGYGGVDWMIFWEDDNGCHHIQLAAYLVNGNERWRAGYTLYSPEGQMLKSFGLAGDSRSRDECVQSMLNNLDGIIEK